jgi:hypothetical protein
MIVWLGTHGGAAVGGALVPRGTEGFVVPGVTRALTEKTMLAAYRDYADLLVETYSSDRVFEPFMRRTSAFHAKIAESMDMPKDTIAFVEEPRQGVAPVLRGVITDLKVPE